MTLKPIPDSEIQRLRRSVLAQLRLKIRMDAGRIAVGLNHALCSSRSKPKPDIVAQQVIQSLINDGSIEVEKLPWDDVPQYVLPGTKCADRRRQLALEIQRRTKGETDPIASKLESAIEELEREGKPFTLAELCLHAKVSTNSIFRHQYRDIKDRAKSVNKQLRDASQQTKSVA